MKLQNLPKDMLVELVSELQDRKEKEYSEYILIFADGPDDTEIEYFKTENELKSWILSRILHLKSESFFDNKNIWMCLEEIRKLHYTKSGEYFRNKAKEFELNELVILTKRVSDRYIIIKGKCLTENGNKIEPIYQ